MANKELHRPQVQEAPAPKGDSAEMELPGKDRRRFIKKAIVTAPVILTVAARPVWARNCTMSGQLSGNLSGPDDCFGEGCSPGFWKNHKDKWHPEFPPEKLFCDVFGVDAFRGATLGDVIDKHDCKTPLLAVFGFHAVAALQNAATSVKFDLTVAEVIRMVSDELSGYDGMCQEMPLISESVQSESSLESLKNYLDRLNNQGSDLCGFE